MNRILVIKLRHLGDVLLSTPVFANLKEKFPNAKIDAYIWKEAEAILAGHPAISHCLLYDRAWKKLSFIPRLFHEIKLWKQIFFGRYDLVINLTEGDRGAIAAFISRAKTKVGVDSKKITRKIFTHLVKPCPTPRHAVERDLDALRKIGIFPTLQQRQLFFAVAEQDDKQAKALVNSTDFILVHAPSRWRFKCLPAVILAEAINKIGYPVVLTGTVAERDFVEEVAALVKTKVWNVAGKTSLKEMGALMRQSLGVITVDSVALHMASALKVPLVALFGPTSELNWGPWMHSRAEVVAQTYSCRPCRLDGCGGSKRSDCLWTLSPQEIAQAFYRVASAGKIEAAASSLFVLNSLETNFTE